MKNFKSTVFTSAIASISLLFGAAAFAADMAGHWGVPADPRAVDGGLFLPDQGIPRRGDLGFHAGRL